MRILAVDDEKLMLESLCDCIREAAPEAELVSFGSASKASAYVEQEQVDVAFLDIRMRGMDGIELGKRIKVRHPNANIVMCTGYDDYIFEAVNEVRCNGYLMKPVHTEDIRTELANLRIPLLSPEKKQKLYLRCFGNFEVFVDGRPLKFQSIKTKELLAYLVDRCGAVCRNGEIMAVLWEDEGSHESYLKKCRKDLLETLEDAGFRDVVVQQWGGMGIDRQRVGCDYYEWLDGTVEGLNAFNGEYMSQYSWSENTRGMFEKISLDEYKK